MRCIVHLALSLQRTFKIAVILFALLASKNFKRRSVINATYLSLSLLLQKYRKLKIHNLICLPAHFMERTLNSFVPAQNVVNSYVHIAFLSIWSILNQRKISKKLIMKLSMLEKSLWICLPLFKTFKIKMAKMKKKSNSEL